MNTVPKDQITTPQAAVIVMNYILGAGILTLPRTAAESVQTPDIWISVILGGVIALVAVIIATKLSQRYPGKTIYQYSQEIIGKWAGRLFSLLMVSYFLLLSGFEVRCLAEVTKLFLLQGTSMWLIIIPFMLIGTYLIVSGINPIARMFEIILPITVFVFILITFMSFKIFEIDNLRPV